MNPENLLSSYLHNLDQLAVGLAVIIFISSVDDFFIDIYYWIREIYRARFIFRRYSPLRLHALQEPPEKWLAIMIPAWQEDKVIGRMVDHLISTMEFSRYMVFIGTYQNDEATTRVVDELVMRHRQVVRATVPVNGPTCKADCLNWIVQTAMLDEKDNGREYAGMIMHDSEDVIHPLELKLFNYLLPKKDFIQLPVLSLEREWTQWVAGTYMDDFAEFHQKDLPVRESLTGFVPGAGVASCYSRRIIQFLIRENANEPFNTGTLTEDYDFSFRMKAMKATQIFVKFPVTYQVRRRRLIGGYRDESVQSYIAPRELFPDKFVSAYRQRARWIIGIVFQGWQSQHWRGNFWTKYFLWRDRKGALTSLVTVLAYFVVVNYILIFIIGRWYPGIDFHSWLNNVPLLLTLMSINLLFFANRIFHRIYFVGKLYGWEQSLLSIPRLIVNNFINFFATLRAWRMFLKHLVTGQRIAWDKTDHAYPSEEQLRTFKRRLGDLLLEWGAIDNTALESVLAQQAETGQLLGKLLLERGVVSADTLANAIAHQSRMRRTTVDFNTLGETLNQLPHRLIVKYRVIPLRVFENVLHVGVCVPLPETARRELEDIHAGPIESFIITETDMSAALRQAATGETVSAGKTNTRRLLGDVMIELKILNHNALAEAVRDYDPKKHRRLGDYLVKTGAITADELERALSAQKSEFQIPGQLDKVLT